MNRSRFRLVGTLGTMYYMGTGIPNGKGHFYGRVFPIALGQWTRN